MIQNWYNVQVKNWSTDTSAFRSEKQKRIWELIQCMNYGFEKEDVYDIHEIKEYWNDVAPHLIAESRRLWEFWVWKRLYSLPVNNDWWMPLPTRIM